MARAPSFSARANEDVVTPKEVSEALSISFARCQRAPCAKVVANALFSGPRITCRFSRNVATRMRGSGISVSKLSDCRSRSDSEGKMPRSSGIPASSCESGISANIVLLSIWACIICSRCCNTVGLLSRG